MPARPSSGSARSTARASATTSRTSSCPRSASGSAMPSRPGPSAPRTSPSRPSNSSTASPKSRPSSKFLQRTFVGKTRFSIEGLDVMVPIVDELIADSAMAGVRHVLIGHGAPRPPQRAGARHAEELRADARRVQGIAGRAAVPRGPGLDRRREVPRRRPRARARGIGARGRDLDAAEPEPPRVREPGGRRHGARRLHRHVGARPARSWTKPPRCRS